MYAPAASDWSRALWKSSCVTLINALNQSFMSLKVMKSSNPYAQSLWVEAVSFADDLINCESLPSPEIEMAKLQEDNSSLLELFSTFHTTILPHVGADKTGACTDEILSKWMSVLEKGSKFWKPADAGAPSYPGLLFGLQRIDRIIVPSVIPVSNEDLARKCLNTLFELAAESNPRLNSVAFHTITVLSKSVISRWISDGPLHLRYPFPRIRIIELKCLLQNLLQLQTTTGQSKHLLILYPEICRLIPYAGTFDPVDINVKSSIGSLVLDCLLRVGEEIRAE